MHRHRNGSTAFGENVVATVDAVQLPPICPEFCDDIFTSHGHNYRSKLIYLLSTKNACIDHAPFTMKRRAERKAVPPNAVGGCAVVEMPAAVAQVGTASDPTYGLRELAPVRMSTVFGTQIRRRCEYLALLPFVSSMGRGLVRKPRGTDFCLRYRRLYIPNFLPVRREAHALAP